MKRRKFIAASSIIGVTAVSPSVKAATLAKTEKEIYEWRTYELKMGASPRLESYLQNALIPCLNRLGVSKVGIFKELSKDEPAKIHVLLVFSSPDSYFKVLAQMKTDSEYLKASESYHRTTPDKAIFDRLASSLMLAFDGMPTLTVPANTSRIFELRTYEGFNEDAVRRKIKMFNEAEIDIFNRTKLHIVFFGEVLVGARLPCLTYMLTFKDMEERNANWAQFSADPDWKKISQAPEYANSVSRIQRVFLEPLAFSQI